MVNPKLSLEIARERIKEAKAADSGDNTNLAVDQIVEILDWLLEHRYGPTTFTTTVGRAGQIVIPMRIREKHKINPGTEVTLDVFIEGAADV